MANDQNDVLDGGQGGGFNPGLNQSQKDANGAYFAAAVSAYGIKTDFGDATERQKQNFWNAQAVKYMGPTWDGQNVNISQFITDFGITYGSKVTHKYSALGDTGISKGGDPAYILQNGDSIEFDYKDNPFNISVNEKIETTTGGVGDDGLRSLGANLAVVSDITGYSQLESIIFTVATRGQAIKTAAGWLRWHAEYKDFNETQKRVDIYIDDFYFELVVVTKTGQTEKSTGGNKTNYLIRSIFLDSTSFDQVITITFDFGSGGGGGGGGGGSKLVFTAISGTSGRHADPLFNEPAKTPTERTEVPAYGCGGFGGHGGAGGAGSATAVVKKFTTGKAESVEQIAVVKRHGFGSGGGKGGTGGDGCILVFW